MLASTDRPALKVLTPTLAERLSVFNKAARTLQQLGVRLLRIEPLENSLTIEPAAGFKIVGTQPVTGFQKHPSAGSTRYVVQFQGVTLEWREPISAARPDDWARNTVH
ncbi:hypothetical protein [Pseudomonas chlororaphis]|uniref:hypothetical protein n=1 Tax=Pseudomonas chlororaphis TaxID=587753 RepID=UPI000F572792|nr:hypothetical protein [Pseudomonas chlororaphis]AZC67398.1 hypothetical protein C4K32_0709 [Pseudomonas chlororaphis subsp. piscium]MBP5056371.1 hypothetical protein [Pseudomonas chlororaphis]MBP5139639.1 hypothetical protein [Pseudomonas chlororaphis]QTT98474.1 hypothetical protein HUT26_04015 [Pseudomonas chlororaphis]